MAKREIFTGPSAGVWPAALTCGNYARLDLGQLHADLVGYGRGERNRWE
jgi:hypothetical protein